MTTSGHMTTEIVMIGAGMAGLSLAALLGQKGFSVTVVDRESPELMAQENYDLRTIALSKGSRQVLEPLGIWDDLRPYGVAIESIDVQEGHDPFLLNFDAADINEEAFGWIFPNNAVRRLLLDAATQYGVQFVQDGLKDLIHGPDHVTATLMSGKNITAKLVLGVDGRNSRTRAIIGVDGVTLPYHQAAWVGIVEHELPHHGLAVERFYDTGPFAILPFTDSKDGVHRSAIVWSHDLPKRATTLPVPANDVLTHMLKPLFDSRYGAIEAVGKWACFPLSLYHAKQMIGDRTALVSDAAHAIHPIAGQGLNLGMRDVAVLAELLGEARTHGTDIGSNDLLETYQRRRRFDVFTMVAATDILNRLFGTKLHSVRWLRSAGLGLVDKVPPLKRFFMRVASGK